MKIKTKSIKNTNTESWDYGIKNIIKSLLLENPTITKIVGDNIFPNHDSKKENYILIEINSIKEIAPNRAKADITISIFINSTNQKADCNDDTIINEIKNIFSHEINFQEKNIDKNIFLCQKTIKQNKNLSSIQYEAFIKTF